MTEITRYPLVRHLRSDASHHVLHYAKGKLVRSGRGLSFWFFPINAALAVVPVEDLELTFLFEARSKDFQEVHTQGVVTYRVTDAAAVANRVDFSIDPRSGTHRKKPLERIAGMLTELAQQHATGYLAANDLHAILRAGPEEIRGRIDTGLSADAGLAGMGIAIVSVRVSQVAPSPEVEKSLRVPVRESIQQEADEATFRRRAQAVEKERAIQENELQNKIELARREQLLIEQRGANEKRRMTDETEAAKINAVAHAERQGLESTAQAAAIRAVEEARVGAERERMAIYRDLKPEQLFGLAAQAFAEKLSTIDHITITPDHAGALLRQLAAGGVLPVGRTEA